MGKLVNFADAKLVYQFFETDYDLHDEVASFSHEEAAIEFGFRNLEANRNKRAKRLFNLEISILYDEVSDYEEHSIEFWNDLDENFKRIEGEIAERYAQHNKKVE